MHPSAEPLDGLTLELKFGWVIDDDDSRYPGETAWLPLWLASGD